MVPVPGGPFLDIAAFIGVMSYQLPPFYIDRFEVTNREYQEFVDKGGYDTPTYWKQPFVRDGRELAWSEAMTLFRDTTARAAPATWVGGHYPEGKADFPVSGVSWFEAEAYAEFRGKSLPVIAQFWKTTPNIASKFIEPLSNNSENPAPVGKFDSLGPFGTNDLIGNVREWYWNTAGDGLHFLLGRLSGTYAPEALSPFDRSPLNGFRCVARAEEAVAAGFLEGRASDGRRVRGLPRDVRVRQDAARLEGRGATRRLGALDAAEDHVQDRLRRGAHGRVPVLAEASAPAVPGRRVLSERAREQTSEQRRARRSLVHGFRRRQRSRRDLPGLSIPL
jgi:hypothetical protein